MFSDNLTETIPLFVKFLLHKRNKKTLKKVKILYYNISTIVLHCKEEKTFKINITL